MSKIHKFFPILIDALYEHNYDRYAEVSSDISTRSTIMKFQILMVIAIIIFGTSCKENSPTSLENATKTLGSKTPISSKTNALDHGASASHSENQNRSSFLENHQYGTQYTPLADKSNDKTQNNTKKASP